MSVITIGYATGVLHTCKVMRPIGPAPRTSTKSPILSPERVAPASATLNGSSNDP